MRWVIKNPAPLDTRLEKWGDFHFGRLLTKQLESRGHEVVSHYDGEWEKRASEAADVVLLLRGKYPLPPGARHAGATHVIWNISHPESVPLEEHDSHDVVCIASETWADQVGKKLERRVWPLLQCTDPEEFYDRTGGGPAERWGVAFVGNTRSVQRPIVRWAVEAGVPLQLYGRGWEALGLADQVVADYVPNDALGELYSSLRFTLNDHWDDMREFGFINNRVFDALACGLPLISDSHDELRRLFPSEIVYCDDRSSFPPALRRMMLSYPELSQAVRESQRRIHGEFTFRRRCEQLLEALGAGSGA